MVNKPLKFLLNSTRLKNKRIVLYNIDNLQQMSSEARCKNFKTFSFILMIRRHEWQTAIIFIAQRPPKQCIGSDRPILLHHPTISPLFSVAHGIIREIRTSRRWSRRGQLSAVSFRTTFTCDPVSSEGSTSFVQGFFWLLRLFGDSELSSYPKSSLVYMLTAVLCTCQGFEFPSNRPSPRNMGFLELLTWWSCVYFFLS